MVDASVNGTVMEILRLCPVKLVYLGNNNFGRLWPKLIPSKDVSTNQTNTIPVFPDSQPLVTIPAPPTLAELETTQALVMLQKHVSDEPTTMPVPNMNLGNNELLLQEPNVLPVLEITDFPLDTPPWVEAEPLIALTDAMDKIVEHTDISHPEPHHWMKSRDCMDIITGRISELVDTVNLSNLPVFECIKIKPCIIELVRIKNIPTVKLLSLQTKEDLLTLGQYFTRSKLRPKKSRQSRKPRWLAPVSIMKRNLCLVIVKRSQKTNDPSPNHLPADRLSQEYGHKLHQLYNPLSDYHLQKNQSRKNLMGKKYQLIWTLLSDLVWTWIPKLNQKLVNLKHRHLPLKREKDSVPMAANSVLKC